MRVLALTKYGPAAASTRQRVLQYRPALAAGGVDLAVAPLLGDDYVRGLADGRGSGRLAIVGSYATRLARLLAARRFDALWVYAELFPYLPGVFERLVRLAGRPVVVDWDDAFFHAYDEHRRPVVRRLLGRKLLPLLDSAAVVTCGNAYLQAYAAQAGARTMLLPTVVDTGVYRTDGHVAATPPVVGWIGSPSTWANVRPLLPLIAGLVGEGRCRFRAIGAGKAAEVDCFPGLELVPWSEASEVAEVQAMDIGIMPLLDRPFERGKCGYKLIQYMACGLPVIASPVGVNATIVSPGESGLLASSEPEWRGGLVRLIEDAPLRERLGRSGRRRVKKDFSLAGHAPRLVALFQGLAGRGGGSGG